MGAALGNQDTAAVRELFQCLRCFSRRFQHAFQLCKQNGKGGERDLRRNDLLDLSERLTVRHHKAWRSVQKPEHCGKLLGLRCQADGVPVQNLPDCLHLRENHASLGGGFVDGRDKYYHILWRKEIPEQMPGFLRGSPFTVECAKPFFQRLDSVTSRCADGNRPLRQHRIFRQIPLVPNR